MIHIYKRKIGSLIFLLLLLSFLFPKIVEWRGSIIPSGTFFMTNMIEMHMDPIKYPNPHEFKPERFLDKSKDSMFASANHKIEDRDQYNFGWGR